LKKDSRKKSFCESLFDVVAGFLLYLPVNFFVLPYFTQGIDEYNVATMLTISLIYTSIALIRKYTIRRWIVGFKGKKNVIKFLNYNR
tara:strand:+ start:1640 stop:1900 length:261 start_codon:yes stop_codon:yes gene_type:complete